MGEEGIWGKFKGSVLESRADILFSLYSIVSLNLIKYEPYIWSGE